MIAPDETIEAADLDALIASALATLKVDNAQLPGGLYVPFRWLIPQGGIPSTARFVVPFDVMVEAVAVRTNDVVGTMTIDVTNDGAGRNFPIQITGTGVAGVVNLTRLLYDGTKGSLDSFATASKAFRVWNKGSITTVAYTTTNVANPSVVDVTLVLRAIFGRD